MRSVEGLTLPAVFLLGGAALAGRRPLDAPPPAEFDPRDHMREEYREAVDRLCAAETASPPRPVRAVCEALASTLNQERLLGELEGADRALQADALRRDTSDEEGREGWLAKLRELAALVRAGHYVLSVPVEFETDLEDRVCRVSGPAWSGDYWRRAWTGPEVRRTVRFIPRMELVVGAEFGRSERGEPACGYLIRNGRGSEADVAGIQIECGGLNRERVAMLADLPHWWNVGDGFVRFALPGPMYLQNFILHVFGPDEKLVVAAPGKTLRIPKELSVPWRSLPEVVACWVEAWLDYPVNIPRGMDVEQDPEDVTGIFQRGGEYPSPAVGHPKSVPR